jgi:hypothetical protein
MSVRRISVVLVLLALGCQQKLPPPPSVYPVKGKLVLSDGKPFKYAVIHLVPRDSAHGIAGQARTKEDGTFSLVCFGGTEGMVPGKYLVSIEPPGVNTKLNFPEKYTDPSTSELTVEVAKSETDMGTIVLK